MALKPPTSPTASVQPSSRSGRSLHDLLGALVAAGLLVGGEAQHHRPLRLGARPRPGPHDREQHRVEVLHVDRAAAPEVAVLDLAGERVDRPVVRRGGYDVEVAVEQQRSRSSTRRRRPTGRRRWCDPRRPRRSRTRSRPRRAAPRRARRPCARPARTRPRSWWCPSGSGRGRCRRPRRQGRRNAAGGLLGTRAHGPILAPARYPPPPPGRPPRFARVHDALEAGPPTDLPTDPVDGSARAQHTGPGGGIGRRASLRC